MYRNVVRKALKSKARDEVSLAKQHCFVCLWQLDFAKTRFCVPAFEHLI